MEPSLAKKRLNLFEKHVKERLTLYLKCKKTIQKQSKIQQEKGRELANN